MSAADDKDQRIAELQARVAELQAQLMQAQGDRAQKHSDVLRKSEEGFRELAEGLPLLIFATDETGASNTYFNGRWKDYTGFESDEKGSYRRLVHRDDLEGADAAWAAGRRSAQPVEHAYRLRGRDGSYRWHLVHGWPVRNAAGTVVRWIGTATDVHELRQAQEALREADRRKDDFLAMLSHELRNPLSPIKNSLYILDHAPAGSDQARHALSVIRRQVDQLVRLVGDLLDITRISRGKIELRKERHDLRDIARRTLEDYRSQFEQSGIRLVLHAEPWPLHIEGDGNRLTQVVGNLLHNAAKFTPRGGSTEIFVSKDVLGRHGVLRVKDSGAGIAKELLARLFQPFMQADTTLERSQGGLGLGLALVKGLVELHGGDITAHSAGLGTGAEFILRLPLVQKETQAAAAAKSAAPVRRRVLIVEDIADVADSLHMVLKLSGHEVAVESNGQRALHKAREFRPEVILCDIGLPGMDGYAVAQALRSDPQFAETYLVALTGYARPEDLKRAAEAGFDRHLAKPAKLELIEEILRNPR